MAKLFVSDLDGTLLTKDHKISEKSINALKRLEVAGYDIALASGRVLSSVRANAFITGLDCFYIANNGAIIANKSEIIYGAPIDHNKLRILVDIAIENDYGFHMYDEDTYYSNVNEESRLKHLFLEDQNKAQAKVYCRPDIMDHIEDNKINIYKIMYHMSFSNDIETYEKLKALGGLYLSMSGGNSADIMKEGVSKGKAIEILEEFLGEKYEKIVCIGDHENDIPMIELADIGIAMGNGIKEVKEMADFVTLTNQEEGFSRAVEYVLEGE